MKRGIQCNETQKYTREKWTTIKFEFVTSMDPIPETIKCKLGDTDPATGKPMNDYSIFEDYHKMRNREINHNRSNTRPELTDREKAERETLRKRLIQEFIHDHGYAPNKDDIRYMMEEKWPTPGVMYIDALTIEDDPLADRCTDFADPESEAAFPSNESDDTAALRDFASKLSGRKRAVYELMLEKTDAGAEQPEWQELAKRWNVSHTQVARDRQYIIEVIRKYSQNEFRFSYDKR